MSSIRYVWAGLTVVATLSTPWLAHADIPPVDACMTVDSACANAGPAGDQPGHCVMTQCSRRTPDGSFVTYDCLRCVSASGTGGATSTGGSAGEAGSGGDSGGSGPESGGAPSPTGGKASTGGTASATGGSANATGGAVSATGGAVSATGGALSATGGRAASTGGAATGGAAAGDHDDGGCSLSPVAAQSGIAALMLALGLSASLMVRRRK